MPRSTLIIGYGNTLRGDDGAGPAVVDRLQRRGPRPGPRLRAAHQLTPELAEELSRHARVVFIDARAAEPPGAIVCEPLQPAADAGGAALTHQFSPAMLLLLARRLYGRQPAAWLIGINGADFDPGEGLSPAVARAVDLVAARWQALIAQTPKESTPCMKRP